jgi:hypothetical protein
MRKTAARPGRCRSEVTASSAALALLE